MGKKRKVVNREREAKKIFSPNQIELNFKKVVKPNRRKLALKIKW